MGAPLNLRFMVQRMPEHKLEHMISRVYLSMSNPEVTFVLV